MDEAIETINKIVSIKNILAACNIHFWFVARPFKGNTNLDCNLDIFIITKWQVSEIKKMTAFTEPFESSITT